MPSLYQTRSNMFGHDWFCISSVLLFLLCWLLLIRLPQGPDKQLENVLLVHTFNISAALTIARLLFVSFDELARYFGCQSHISFKNKHVWLICGLLSMFLSNSVFCTHTSHVENKKNISSFISFCCQRRVFDSCVRNVYASSVVQNALEAWNNLSDLSLTN